MKINVISLAAYVLLFLVVAKGAFSINGNSKLSTENIILRSELSKLDYEISGLEQERERLPQRLKHLRKLESIWQSSLQEDQLTLSRLNAEKRLKKLEEDQKKAEDELAKSETKKKKTPQRSKMSSRRKYFLSHGMYPEQYAARQSQRAIISEQRRSAQVAHARDQQQQKQQAYENWILQPTAMERALNQARNAERNSDAAAVIRFGQRTGNPLLIRRGTRMQLGLKSGEDWRPNE
ncbi:MAG: hypothetical protein QF858_00075 [Candidatus Pacebacteria bacterium]|jgi:chromosome segregation ATPase|nr:hypothetical protein [Candidatus Paceibacterota bacterium]